MLRRLSLFLFVFVLGGCAQEAKTPASAESKPLAAAASNTKKNASANRWTNAISHKARWSADQAKVVVEVVVQPGFHVYTKGETTGRPISLAVDDASGYEIVGEIIHPPGITKKLEIGTSVIVEGTAEIKAAVKKSRPDARDFKGTFGYQVCTDSACDRPRKVPFTLAAPKPNS